MSTASHANDVAFQLGDRLPALVAAGVVTQLPQVALTIALVLAEGTVVLFATPPVLNEVIQLIWKVPAAHRLEAFDYNFDLSVWASLLRRERSNQAERKLASPLPPPTHGRRSFLGGSRCVTPFRTHGMGGEFSTSSAPRQRATPWNLPRSWRRAALSSNGRIEATPKQETKCLAGPLAGPPPRKHSGQ